MLRASNLSVLFLLLTAAAARADCAADFAAAMEAHKNAGPYHTETQMTIDDATRVLISDVILPDKVHIIKDATEHEYLITANGAWTRLDGEWARITDKKRDEILNGKAYSLASGFKAAQNVQCLGPQSIEGKTLTAFGFEMVNAEQNNRHIREMVYLDDKGVPAILTSEFAFDTHKVRTLSHVTHDAAITIEAPVTGPPAATTNAADPACLVEIKSLTDAIASAGPLRYSIVDKSAGQPMKITAELIPATAMRIAWEGGEQIFNSSGGWMKEGGTWKPLPTRDVAEAQLEFSNPWWAKPESLNNLKCLGAQDFEGAKHPAFAFDFERFLGAKAMQHMTLFKGQGNLPVAMSVLKESQTSEAALVAHLTFDKAIRIEQPK